MLWVIVGGVVIILITVCVNNRQKADEAGKGWIEEKEG